MYMVQMEAPSTPECHDCVQSQIGQKKEKHRVVHHVQEEHYEDGMLDGIDVANPFQM